MNFEYKTQTLTKDQMLMTNGIFTVDRDKNTLFNTTIILNIIHSFNVLNARV